MVKQKSGVGEILSIIITCLLLIITIIPIWQMLVIAFSPSDNYIVDPFHMIPKGFSVAIFTELFSSSRILRAMGLSLVVVLFGWFMGITLAAMGAYALNKLNKYKIKGRKVVYLLIIFTMFFNGGIIPMFIWFRKIQITDTIFSLFLPSLINTFYLFLMKNYFSTIPESMEEAATIEGCNHFQILFKIVFPISKPVIAAVSLFLIVQYWNDYYFGMLFINDTKLYPLGLILRNAIINKQMVVQTVIGDQGQLTSEQYNMALVIVSLVPIFIIYPFIQKYFVSGIMIGAVKE
jgi:putative aldouronate transport system permease protein